MGAGQRQLDLRHPTGVVTEQEKLIVVICSS